MAVFLSIDKGSVQFSLVAQSCLTLCDPINRSTPGLPVQHQLPELLRLTSIFLLLLECLLHEGWHDFCCLMSLVSCAFYVFFFVFLTPLWIWFPLCCLQDHLFILLCHLVCYLLLLDYISGSWIIDFLLVHSYGF